jgi:hypothetical protein
MASGSQQRIISATAGKYGALSVDAGRVDVRWRVEGDTFMMSWTERNGPPVSRPERHGFGSPGTDADASKILRIKPMASGRPLSAIAPMFQITGTPASRSVVMITSARPRRTVFFDGQPVRSCLWRSGA